MPAFPEAARRVRDRVAAIEADVAGFDAPAEGLDHGSGGHDHQPWVGESVTVLVQLPAAIFAGLARERRQAAAIDQGGPEIVCHHARRPSRGLLLIELSNAPTASLRGAPS